ncbi:MAG: VanZ family protein, partial [Candidatus Nanohaloarchaea archaeon]|nr:VanZ family protein [Candidatus Nanohaloarchaea archaeon]
AGALLLVFNDTARGHGEAVLLAVLFGVVIEVLQGMVPYRSMAAVDVLFNTAGASLVLFDHHFDAVTRVVALEDRWIERYLL